ncbi:hypothetical protein LZZ85_19720 [Terrimonas sp. NA20]|uniref:WD40 repeat domain-containing protein n=1 Tax=Terrimonas ginsenosidimutans TaxID=2908004 RepID=A0ABS9KWD3_9BACT|nr:hypothetical protein [Terrimonas ginsenosidimutans]MCG2616539.1 hypothetical protein [Terrimonas ginsenosidimutans]
MKLVLSVILISLTLCSACDKSKSKGSTDSFPSDLSGTIYYKWATEGIIKVSFPSATGGTFIQDDTKLNSFDISRDGQYRLTAVNAATLGNDNVKFTLSNNSSGAIINEFVYQSRAGNRYCKGYLSPDNKLIMVESNDRDDGIVILKVTGEELLTIDGLSDVPFDIHDMKMWLPNNEILLTHAKKIIRLVPPYNSASLVKQMDYADWGHLVVNQQGSQLAMHIANHIYTMDIDGNNLKQVTISEHKEARPVFSPDGKHLMIGSNYRQSSIMGHSWDMKIIPNDGKQYNVDPFAENSSGVISVVLDGKDKIVSGSGQVIWK